MPTYEYVCEKCDASYKETRGMNEPEKKTTCAAASCGGNLKRIFNAPPIQFKGTGFSSNRG
jgi:putative FmdB family regulatory protein